MLFRSSHQFDTAERGFSIRMDGPLDMRMNHQSSLSAHQVVNEYNAENLTRLFRLYGEVEKPHVAARQIITSRPISSTHQLIKALIGDEDWKNHHQFLAKVFQSIRIEVNKEMEVLESLLVQLPELIE